MVDHFLNPKFSGAPYDLCYFLIKARKNKKKYRASKNPWV